MRVLIIEDEHKIANSIKKGLEQEGFAVDVTYDGLDGYDMASTEGYDAITLDLMLPGMDGIELCKKLRKDKVHTPIIMLTAKGSLDDRVDGLNCGADDYLVKPFSFQELLARLRALTRRNSANKETILEHDNLSLDPITFEVNRKDKKIKLSKKEFSLLEYLLRNKETIVTKDTIINHVWDYDADILPNTVEVYIGYLRRKIDDAFPKEKKLIQTVRGFGYKLETQNKK